MRHQKVFCEHRPPHFNEYFGGVHTGRKYFMAAGEIINSFSSKPGVGLPLGNLTSQLLVNIYMNEFDQFAKHKLKAKYYIRYADDFVIFSENRNWLSGQIPQIRKFLRERLNLELHSKKIFIKTLASGVDFLGWVHFPDYRVLRTATRKNDKKNKGLILSETLNSYLGLLSHGNTHKLKSKVLKEYFLSQYN